MREKATFGAVELRHELDGVKERDHGGTDVTSTRRLRYGHAEPNDDRAKQEAGKRHGTGLVPTEAQTSDYSENCEKGAVDVDEKVRPTHIEPILRQRRVFHFGGV